MADAMRIKRLEQVILQTVAPLLATGLSDPRLSMVTVTRVKLSADMSTARINWSTMGTEADRSKAEHALSRAHGPVQRAIADSLQTRTTPRVHFHYDESMEKAQRINEILSKLRVERGEHLDPEEAEAEDGDVEDADAASDD